ncbi:MAG: hypothetical protein GWO16_15805 [Gammaproteobacteria bacterium]|nr:hypothetical protein [Gammaproteobacteria bacterium]NIT63166.1 hypothetical protein [Gammaproteobacteria bacterium]NIY31746.1 hypothetical protein [Gammaproteobacteria bacterium]
MVNRERAVEAVSVRFFANTRLCSRQDAKNAKGMARMAEYEIGRSGVGVSLQIRVGDGPGLPETVYEAVLAHELGREGLSVERQVAILAGPHEAPGYPNCLPPPQIDRPISWHLGESLCLVCADKFCGGASRYRDCSAGSGARPYGLHGVAGR